MNLKFNTGIGKVESIEISENQVQSLVDYLLDNNIVFSCAILNSFKTKKYLDPDYIDDFRYFSYLEK